MSKAPRDDTQALRDPVRDTANVFPVLHSVKPLSPPGSGVPATAACHSAFDGNRLRAFSHAACAWNHVIRDDGVTPATLTASMSSEQFCPLSAWSLPHDARRVVMVRAAVAVPPAR